MTAYSEGYATVPLEQKRVPLSDLDVEVAKDFAMVIERQRGVDVSGLQRRVLAEEPALWDPSQQKDNVPIHRAGHDKWGIGKVVFIFCDDYLKNVFQFPWFHAWQAELAPVFEQVGIPVDRIVRCILASMPPGADIPVHHDTGNWVQHTHRMHIPLFTDPSIDFMVGPNVDRMERYEFQQGTLYELNNISKHRVKNNWDQRRVHLIFDYVEPDFPLARMDLQPGTVVHQSRRTLDLSTSYGSRASPTFMVIGAQKAGTTSLYDYIVQHDLVLPSRRKETHYFDWRWNGKLPDCATADGAKQHLEYYYNFFETPTLKKCPSLHTGEATPSYLLGGRVVIERMQRVIPHCRKILAILRNPADRAYSHYSMTADPEGSPQQLRNRGFEHLQGRSFETLVDDEIAHLAKVGVHPDMSFEDFDVKVLRPLLTLDHGAHSFVTRGLYALQLAGWIQAYSSEQVLVVSLDDMKTSTDLHATMDKVFDFLEFPPHRIQDESAKNTRKYEPMAPATREKLAAFYAPYNRKLNELLGRDFGW